MPASVFDFAAIRARLDELGGRQSVRPTPGLARILVVDDSEVNVELLVAVLAAEHYVVSAAYDGSEALAKIEAEKPDIILLDIMMPGLDGYEVCRRVKADPATADIRVMMVTALSGVDDLKRAFEAGADDYLTTPVNGLALMARIRGQLRRKRLQDRLQENFERSLSLALTDELTGLYNRRYLLAHLDELLDRVNHDRTSAAVLLLDIDHFRQVNDTYGHAAGDDVLRELATRARNSVRSVDLVARLGGEEFVVVMPETDIVIATEVAELLRLAVAREPFIIGTGGMKVAVTISIGATVAASGDGRAELLKRADNALYSAKNGGRNQVVVLPPE
jgi:two-component system cell cycle response regulator